MINNPYDSLLVHLAKCNDKDEIKSILTALLTEKEQHEITNRILIFELLDRGMSQRDISEQLGVGIATVSRGAKAIQHHDVSALLATHRNGTDEGI